MTNTVTKTVKNSDKDSDKDSGKDSSKDSGKDKDNDKDIWRTPAKSDLGVFITVIRRLDLTKIDKRHWHSPLTMAMTFREHPL